VQEFEYEHSPERAFEEARLIIATTLGDAITHELNEQLSLQSAQGIEPETNGMSVTVMRMAAKRSTEWVAAAGHMFVLKFSVAAIKPKTEERPTGSDIAIFFEVLPRQNIFSPIVSKTLLIQAKVGKISLEGEISVSDRNLPGQLRQIQRVSPNDGFLLVYTSEGAYCIGISEALNSLNGNTVRTKRFSPAGSMLSEVVMCNAGNERSISPARLNPARDIQGNLLIEDAARKLAIAAGTFPVEEAISVSITVSS